MEFQALYVLVTSMVLNFIVLGISLNRPDSFFPVSLSAISISLQGYALRLIAINSVIWGIRKEHGGTEMGYIVPSREYVLATKVNLGEWESIKELAAKRRRTISDLIRFLLVEETRRTAQ